MISFTDWNARYVKSVFLTSFRKTRCHVVVIGGLICSLFIADTLQAQTIITEDETQVGGTVDTPTDGETLKGVLQITHHSNNPQLRLTQNAVRNSAAVVVGSLGGEEGRLLISGGSSLNNNMGDPDIPLGSINSTQIHSGRGYLGLRSGSTGTATVTGTGSQWNNSSSLVVGGFGNGSLNVEDGGKVTSGYSVLGFASSTQGSSSINGAGSNWTIFDRLDVGHAGRGDLTVTNGGYLNSAAGIVGWLETSAGEATVTGSGSRWDNNDSLIVGDYGVGKLNIQDGGYVSNTFSRVGTFEGSTGNVDVRGTGSTWNNSSNLHVGWRGNGSLDILNGGTVTSVGYSGIGHDYSTNPDSKGSVSIDGVGSNWELNNSLHVGRAGRGELTVTNGGLIKSHEGIIGTFGTGNGTANLNGAGSRWENSSWLVVGDIGTGYLGIENGARVWNTTGYIGQVAGASGLVEVKGTGAEWTNNEALLVSNGGLGEVRISDGGKVTSGYSILGYNHSTNTAIKGVVSIDGTGSNWTTSDRLDVGRAGRGELSVTNGGQLNTAAGIIGWLGTSNGKVDVMGSGSRWNNANWLVVGDSGNGQLNILDGGHVSSTYNLIGTFAGSAGAVTVRGAESTWETITSGNSALQLGVSGTGLLVIEDGGQVVFTGPYAIGSLGVNATGRGIVYVRGTGSEWTLDRLDVGVNGNASLTVADGGLVRNNTGVIGVNSGSTGEVNVIGNGSRWEPSWGLGVGISGTGTLQILDGGSVTVGGIAGVPMSVGLLEGSQGIVRVSGPGSELIIQSQDGLGYGLLSLGHSDWGTAGSARLEVLNGGRVYNAGIVAGNAQIFVNESDLTTGNLNVGGNSVLQLHNAHVSTDSLYVSGNVEVYGDSSYESSAARLVAAQTIVGDHGDPSTPRRGAVSVAGDRVTFEAGVLGVVHGEVTVSDSASMNSSEAVLALNGLVNVNGSGSRWVNSGDMYIGGNKNWDGFGGSLVLTNQAVVEVGNDAKVWDSGNIQISSGASMSVSGLIINGGLIDVQSSGVLSAGQIVVSGHLHNDGQVFGSMDIVSDGVITGAGSFQSLTVGSGGVVNPGSSPGLLTSEITTWGGGGTYIWEINQLGADGGAAGAASGWDLWNVGELNITATNNDLFSIALTSLTDTNDLGFLSGWDAFQNQQWLIATSNNGGFNDLSGLSLNWDNFANGLGGGTFSLSSANGGNDLYLNFSAVPEPSSALLVGIASAACLLRRRSRKKIDVATAG